MIHHCKAVRKGAPNTFCILAMPLALFYKKYVYKKCIEDDERECGHKVTMWER